MIQRVVMCFISVAYLWLFDVGIWMGDFLWGSKTKTSLHHEAERLNTSFPSSRSAREEKKFTYATWAFLCAFLSSVSTRGSRQNVSATYYVVAVMKWYNHNHSLGLRLQALKRARKHLFSVSFDTVFPPRSSPSQLQFFWQIRCKSSRQASMKTYCWVLQQKKKDYWQSASESKSGKIIKIIQ